MIKLIVGVKGTGKTKILINEIEKASGVSNGNIVCVEYKKKLTFDLPHYVRLVDATEYGITDAAKLYGFICGILAGNYDVTHLFLDGTLKIVDPSMLEKFVTALNKISVSNEVDIVITVSMPEEELPESIKEFLL